jgi:hypothetical protein
MNLAVKLGDKFVKVLLKFLCVGLLGTLNRLDVARQLADLLDTLSEVVLVLFLDLKLELSKGVINLAEEIYSVTNVLEVFVNVVQVTVLFNEIFNVANGLGEI